VSICGSHSPAVSSFTAGSGGRRSRSAEKEAEAKKPATCCHFVAFRVASQVVDYQHLLPCCRFFGPIYQSGVFALFGGKEFRLPPASGSKPDLRRQKTADNPHRGI
jgi:hypothetical protein